MTKTTLFAFTSQPIEYPRAETRVERKGRYGFAVEWGDGVTIYSKKTAVRAAEGNEV